MDLGIAGRRALVTGGGRGLGAAIAACLAREGARVAIVARTAADLERVMGEMDGAGHYALCTDLSAEGAPTRVLLQLEREFGPLDIVVHNLGGTLDITQPDCSLDDWRRLWRLNLEVALEINLRVLPPMRAQKWGRVVHISSIAAMENQGPVPYCAIKAALTAYTRSMGRVVASDGVVMSAILPGAVFTQGGYWDLTARRRPEHLKRYLAERMAIGRLGRPEEIARAVAFVCSEAASFFVGSIVPIDGGQGRSFFGL
jgi:NAD(P)-dependent dehydrogenase (short-subunit alcohol dehydrogenase family)